MMMTERAAFYRWRNQQIIRLYTERYTVKQIAYIFHLSVQQTTRILNFAQVYTRHAKRRASKEALS